MRRFRDIETGKIITLDQLEAEFLLLQQAKETEAVTFKEYLNNCLDRNNGVLEELPEHLYKAHSLQRRVAQDIACAEIGYEQALESLSRNHMFEDWTYYEFEHRPVDVDSLAECVAQDLGIN